MEYIIYRCKICGKKFKLSAADVKHSEEEYRYITCPFDGRHKKIGVIGTEDTYGDIKECMGHSSYKREKGSLKQKR